MLVFAYDPLSLTQKAEDAEREKFQLGEQTGNNQPDKNKEYYI